MKFYLLLFLIIFVCMPLYAVSALETYTVFEQGTNGYHTFRIPALLSVPNGPLLAFCEGRVWSRWDRGNIDVVLKRSFDGGKTWGSLQVVWSKGEETCGNPTAVYDSDTGRIWLLMSNNKNTVVDPTYSSNDAVIRDGQRKVWVCYSDNDGANWSTPVDISADVQPYWMQPSYNYWDALGPGNGIQLRRGTHKGRLIIPAVERNIYSDDNGVNWSYSGLLGDGTNESTVAELADGRLIRNDRADSGGSYGSYYRRMISYSYNQSSSWSAYQQQPELITPLCHAAMIRYQPSDASQMANILLFSGPDSTEERIDMTVKVSENQGDSWGISKLIYPDSSAYSSMAVDSNNIICLLFENGDGWPYHRISVARFDLDWLYDTTVAMWDFEEKPVGQVTSILSGAIKDSSGYELNARAETFFSYVQGSQVSETAIDFEGKDYGIVLSFDETKGLMDFFATDSFLIKAMIKTDNHGTGDYPGAIISKDSGSENPQWWLRIEDGKVRFHINDSNDATSVWSNKTVNDGQWHHIVAGRDVNKDRLFIAVDYRLDAEAVDATMSNFANDYGVVIGRFNTTSTRCFEGQIDYVRIMKSTVPDILPHGDLNSDGIIDCEDLFILIQNWIKDGWEEL